MGVPTLGWGKEVVALVINVTQPQDSRDEIVCTCHVQLDTATAVPTNCREPTKLQHTTKQQAKTAPM